MLFIALRTNKFSFFAFFVIKSMGIIPSRLFSRQDSNPYGWLQ